MERTLQSHYNLEHKTKSEKTAVAKAKKLGHIQPDGKNIEEFLRKYNYVMPKKKKRRKN